MRVPIYHVEAGYLHDAELSERTLESFAIPWPVLRRQDVRVIGILNPDMDPEHRLELWIIDNLTGERVHLDHAEEPLDGTQGGSAHPGDLGPGVVGGPARHDGEESA